MLLNLPGDCETLGYSGRAVVDLSFFVIPDTSQDSGLQTEAQKSNAPNAWQPFTPGGVAAFSRASFPRLFWFQFGFAAINAVALGWYLQISWIPVMQSAVDHLPERGGIARGVLTWDNPSPVLLAYNSDLAFVVDLLHTGEGRVPSDLLVEFGRRDLRIYSLFGFIEVEYGSNWNLALNQRETVPWWGAWRPPFLWMAVLGAVGILMGGWAVLATVYCLVVWLISILANRRANLPQSWRLAGAAMMPASLLLVLGIVLYGSGAINLPGLLLLAAAHVIVGWAYVLIAPLALARDPDAVKANPFGSS